MMDGPMFDVDPGFAMPIAPARIEAILGLLRPCRLLADVGTDHGFVPVLAVQRNLAERAIASDLREAPIQLAQRHIARAALTDRVDVVRGDGLLALENRGADAVVIAGMGGELIRSLCEAAPHVLLDVRQLVLQPNQNAEFVRSWARENGWHLREETMLERRGRFFVVTAFERGTAPDPAYLAITGWDEGVLLRVGPLLARRKDPMALRFCEAQRDRLDELVKAGRANYAPELAGFRIACERLRPE